jgi:catechol 2,3-dioxygenase-like lactoylglutathione lyase family enzyme
VELLEGTSETSPISKFIVKKGEGIHHVAFEVENIEAEMKRLSALGFELLSEAPKNGADNKLVCSCTRNRPMGCWWSCARRSGRKLQYRTFAPLIRNMITGIRHIIFDLGGVILNLDYNLTEQAFIEAGVTNFGELYSQLKQSDLFDRWETGKMPREEFIEAMQKASSSPLTEEQILKAWNAMLLDFPDQEVADIAAIAPAL